MRIDNPQIQMSGSSNSGLRRNITFVGNAGSTIIPFIADGKLFAAKGNDAGNAAWQQALYPSASGTTGLQTGVNNMYEIAFPGESGSLVKADFYGIGAYALFDNGNLYTWGYNAQGQLGLGNTVTSDYPQRAATDVTDVYTHNSQLAGETSNTRLIIKKSDGKIYGAGYNGYYQFGSGSQAQRNSFTELEWAGINPLSVWNLGGTTGIVIVQKSDGTIAMTGYNAYGRLGNDTQTSPAVAISASSGAWLNNDTSYRIKWVHGGERFFNGTWAENTNLVMLLDNGTQTRIVGAGDNSWKTLGDGTTTLRKVPTVPTGTWTNVVQMASKGCAVGSVWALKSDGTLWNWGRNQEGQLGRGNTTDGNPTQVMTGVAKIWEGSQMLYYNYFQPSPIIEKTDGTYWCAGYNDYFGTGAGVNPNDPSGNDWTVFFQMRFPADFRMKHFGQTIYNNNTAVNYAVSMNDEIWCWGYNGGYHIDPNDGSGFAVPTKFAPNVLQR